MALPPEPRGEIGHGLGGDYWATAAYLLVALLLVMALAGALPHAPEAEAPSPELDPQALALARSLVEEQTGALRGWRELLADLCTHPELAELGLAPDCETGTISLANALFSEDTTSELTSEGRQKVRTALPIVLAKLRENDRLWDRLDVIEIRGHADPRAHYSPYTTNLRLSQRRALSVLLYLASPGVMSDADRADVERLAVSSAASFSRPPAECPEATHDCFEQWRRVEIRFGVDDWQARDELEQLVAPVGAVLNGIGQP